MNNNFSQNCIVDSLIILMDKNNFENITMDDISQKSGVSRRTIYRYFKNKHEILNKYIEGLLDEYLKYINNSMDEKNIVESSFEFAQLHYAFFKVAYKNNLLINVVELLENAVSKILAKSKTNYFNSLSPEKLKNYTSFVAGGIWGVMRNWIQNNGRQSPKELYLNYKQIVHDLQIRLS